MYSLCQKSSEWRGLDRPTQSFDWTAAGKNSWTKSCVTNNYFALYVVSNKQKKNLIKLLNEISKGDTICLPASGAWKPYDDAFRRETGKGIVHKGIFTGYVDTDACSDCPRWLGDREMNDLANWAPNRCYGDLVMNSYEREALMTTRGLRGLNAPGWGVLRDSEDGNIFIFHVECWTRDGLVVLQ